MGVGGGPRGPRVHLWDGPGCSRVRGRRRAGLRTDHSGSRRDILMKHSQQHLDKVLSSSSSGSRISSSSSGGGRSRGIILLKIMLTISTKTTIITIIRFSLVSELLQVQELPLLAVLVLEKQIQ